MLNCKLEHLEEKWGKKYPVVTNSWKNNWSNLSNYFQYSEEIRKLIYTTNSVEALHRQLRKVTKTKSLFPHDDALKKMLFLAYRDIAKKWNKPIANWPIIVSQLSIIFKDRMIIQI